MNQSDLNQYKHVQHKHVQQICKDTCIHLQEFLREDIDNSVNN